MSSIASAIATASPIAPSSAAFPAYGEIRIGTEDISFTANDTSTGTLSGGARNVNGTTLAGHTAGATITNISDYVAWGEASSADFTINPGLWILDNYGTKLIALIYNGQCFEWDSSIANPSGKSDAVKEYASPLSIASICKDTISPIKLL